MYVPRSGRLPGLLKIRQRNRAEMHGKPDDGRTGTAETAKAYASGRE
jgi:hypothetical protein